MKFTSNQQPATKMPLRWKIPLLYAIIMFAVLAGGGLLLYNQQRELAYANAAARLRDQARNVIDQFLPGDGPGGRNGPQGNNRVKTLEDLADALASRDVGAAIYRLDGTLVVTGTRGFNLPAPSIPQLARDQNDNAPPSLSDSDTGRVLSLILAPRPGRPEDANVAVQVGIRTAALEESLNGLALGLGVGIALVLTAATALGVFATRRALHPLQKVVNTSLAIAAGDLTQRVGLSGADEVGQLGGAFDGMVAQIEDSFAAQKRFVADAAHELRTPLTALSGSVELLRMGATQDDPAKSDRMLRHLDVELTRVIRLTNDLLTLSALDAQPKPTLKPTDLSALLRETAEQYAPIMAAHAFSVNVADGLRAQADGDRLRQVFINLLDNARKHTPAGKAITLRAWKEGNRACVEVRDEGEGIPAEALPKLFDRFYRVDDARSRSTGGSGLGLAIAKAIVDAHGGQLAVTSETGKGTMVRCWLPAIA